LILKKTHKDRKVNCSVWSCKRWITLL